MSQASVAGCADVCVSCSSALKTFANLQVVGDEKYLRATWMPPGGCTCLSLAVDPACRRCFPRMAICQTCGDRRPPTTPPVPVCATPDAADRTEGEQQ